MDPKRIHEQDQIMAATRALAWQATVFFNALLEEGMPRDVAMFLTGEMIADLLTMGHEKNREENDA